MLRPKRLRAERAGGSRLAESATIIEMPLAGLVVAQNKIDALRVRRRKVELVVSNTLIAKMLETKEFLESVYALSPAVAVFDCDGTLWSGDAGSGFMNWTIDTGLVSREATDWIDGRYRGYKRGEVSELAICGEMVQLYQGLREEEMRKAARDFFSSRVERISIAAARNRQEHLS